MEKRYFIENLQIKWYTFLCDHPGSVAYVVVLDMYEKPQRIIRPTWESLTITDYEKAKLALIDALKEETQYWENTIVKEP